MSESHSRDANLFNELANDEGFDETDVVQEEPHATRRRRDSQVGPSYGDLEDPQTSTAIFDGPSSYSFPNSVSSMYHERQVLTVRSNRESRRLSRNLERGRSTDSLQLQRQLSSDSQVFPEGDSSISARHIRISTDSRRSPSPPIWGTGTVFENIASFFTRSGPTDGTGQVAPSSGRSSILGSRTSLLSRRSSAYSRRSSMSQERWGYESDEDLPLSPAGSDSEKEGSVSDISSRPPSIIGGLPLFSHDPLFGDSHQHQLATQANEHYPLPFNSGPPSRQQIFLADEDVTALFVGYEIIPWKSWAWKLGCIATAGGLALMGHWFPRLWLSCTMHEQAFIHISQGYIVVETAHKELTIFPLEKKPYSHPLSTIFSESSEETTTYRRNFRSLNKSFQKQSVTFVDYRYSKFALNPNSGLFAMVRDWRDSNWLTINAVQNGLTTPDRTQRASVFGRNSIDIKAKSTISLLVDEVIHPFYVFQIASIILWSLDDYYYYAFCIGVISVFSVCNTLIETRKTVLKMRELARFSCPVGALVDGIWETIDSSRLVVGDIINLSTPPLETVPADVMICSGDAIVNESMLTGESVPVSKIAARDVDLLRWRNGVEAGSETAKNILYFGTRLVRIRKEGSTDAIGLVLRTGFDTTKGALIRSMLFPKPMGFKFYRDSIRFIGVLACVAGVGFIISAGQFVHLGVPIQTIIIRALDLITVVVPPALPATLSIGTSFALARLRKATIFCISPNRVNIAGKINVVCFDKTGTLTEEGLDILGVRIPERSGERFGELVEDARDLPLSSGRTSFLHALATCHSLKMVNGSPLGDPLDVKMFSFTDWTLEEGESLDTSNSKNTIIRVTTSGSKTPLVQSIVRPPGTSKFRIEDALKGGKRAHFTELGVIRSFEFISVLRRMSVIVKRLKSSSMEVYVKGAPEVMSEICTKESFPKDYNDLLSYYTKRGYRVIAMAGKSIEGLSWLKAQRMKREVAERELVFLGLIVFENKIKSGTFPAIKELRSAHMGCRMVTGDNPRTAVSVARECGMLGQATQVFLPQFVQGVTETRVQWASVDDDELLLDEYSLRPLSIPHHYSVEADGHASYDYALAVTGDVFRWMLNNAPIETLHRMLVKTQVYARMSPDEKHEVVERLQSLGYTVAFCGDGANDCGALKAADVGIALSEAEASVAAPFTSQSPDIGCVTQVIKEGRAALVTSFSCFKYMALYSLIQFITITLLYSFASSLGDFQFLYIDLFIIIPVAVTMGRTLPFETIYTKRPTANLVSKTVLASVIGQVLISGAFQFWAFLWVRRQSWYEFPDQEGHGNQLESFNFENTALFLVSSFQYIFIAIVYSIGPPYRKPMRTNGLFIISVTILIVFSGMVLLSPPSLIAIILDIKTIPPEGKLTLLIGVVLNVTASFVFERYLQTAFGELLGLFGRLQGLVQSVRHNSQKSYKNIETGMTHSTGV